jgi:hypothetical protein
LKAFRTFGRFSEMVATSPSLSKRRFSYTFSSPFSSDKVRASRSVFERGVDMVFVGFFSLLAGLPGRASALRLLLLYRVDASPYLLLPVPRPFSTRIV